MGKFKEPIVKLENILSPQEMKERFGSAQYKVSGDEKGLYINSDYMVEKLLGFKTNDPEFIIREIPRAYLSILKEVREARQKKRYLTLFEKVNRAENTRK